MYLLVIFLPLLSAIFSGFFGFYVGQKGSSIISVISLFFSAFLSYVIAFEILFLNSSCYLVFFNWSELLNLKWSFLFDGITSVMLCVVLTVSALVHLYSVEYMKGDPHLSRFMSFLSLFTFFMLLLVTSANYIQLFLGWEGVGLCSYLLISFWFTRLQANKAAIKAIIVNKIGDFGIICFLMSIYYYTHSFDFSVIFPLIPFLINLQFNFTFLFFDFSINYISFLALMLFLGAIGKSAQLFLHTWLPDAMEGPTPVSALIHAATMVTAGVFVIIRSSIIFEYSGFVLSIVTIVGGCTALFAASIGMLQYDLKKVIAYSTCSQLGYMIFACGLSAYNVSLFHLSNHAFFKALLFLSAGSIIHALASEQDMRRMGGLIHLLPFSYTMFIIGSLALAGFPFLSGFYSKDVILEIAASRFTISGNFVFWLGSLSAFLTAYYSFRLIYLTFFSITNSKRSILVNSHDAPLLMAIPLVILAFGSIFFGYLFKDLFIGLGSFTFSNSIFILYPHLAAVEAEFISSFFKLIPLFFSFFGIFLALFLNFFLNLFYFL